MKWIKKYNNVLVLVVSLLSIVQNFVFLSDRFNLNNMLNFIMTYIGFILGGIGLLFVAFKVIQEKNRDISEFGKSTEKNITQIEKLTEENTKQIEAINNTITNMDVKLGKMTYMKTFYEELEKMRNEFIKNRQS